MLEPTELKLTDEVKKYDMGMGLTEEDQIGKNITIRPIELKTPDEGKYMVRDMQCGKEKKEMDP